MYTRVEHEKTVKMVSTDKLDISMSINIVVSPVSRVHAYQATRACTPLFVWVYAFQNMVFRTKVEIKSVDQRNQLSPESRVLRLIDCP